MLLTGQQENDPRTHHALRIATMRLDPSHEFSTFRRTFGAILAKAKKEIA